MILYLGNNLTLHGNTPSSIETLGKLLSDRYTVKRYSSKSNQVVRFIDMMVALIRYRKKAKVVLIDTYSSLAFYYAVGAAIACQWMGIEYVAILRGGNLSVRLNKNPRLSRLLFGSAHRLIAPSEFLFSVFREHGFTKILFIPNSIEIEKYTFDRRRMIHPRLLWVRSFHKVYNPGMAIDVLDEIKKRFPEAELCMVGPDKDGSLLQCKTYAVQKGLEHNVKFTGVLSKSDWHSLAREYDVFINTTTIDNTPVSVIEAMALGLPVVSTNVGGMPYLIKPDETGILVNTGDVYEMVRKIIFLIENSEKAQAMSIEARRYVDQFSWNQVRHQWFQLLDPLCNEMNSNETLESH